MPQVLKFDYRAVVTDIPLVVPDEAAETRFAILADVEGLFLDQFSTLILSATLQFNTNVKIYNYPFLPSQFYMNSLSVHQCNLTGISFWPGVVSDNSGNNFVSFLHQYVESLNGFSATDFLTITFGLVKNSGNFGFSRETITLKGLIAEMKMTSETLAQTPYINFSLGILIPAYLSQGW